MFLSRAVDKGAETLHILDVGKACMGTESAADLTKSTRDHHGWSQQVLADKMNKHQKTISRWERGTHEPSFSDAQRLQKLRAMKPKKRSA